MWLRKPAATGSDGSNREWAPGDDTCVRDDWHQPMVLQYLSFFARKCIDFIGWIRRIEAETIEYVRLREREHTLTIYNFSYTH